jgi:hypothetical protein
MGTRDSFPGIKRPRREADHSPPSSAEDKNAWSYTSTPQYVFMAWCLIKRRDSSQKKYNTWNFEKDSAYFRFIKIKYILREQAVYVVHNS